MSDFNVNLYLHPPEGEGTIDEIERLCNERLQLYNFLASGEDVSSENVQKCLQKSSLPQLLSPEVTPALIKARREDLISHWALRLAYSKSEFLSGTFIRLECQWFRLRFLELNLSEVLRFIDTNGLLKDKLTDDDKLRINSEIPGANLSDEIYYKVKAKEARTLLKLRAGVVQNGFLYFPLSLIIYYVCDKLESILENGFAHACKVYPTLDHEQMGHLLPVLKMVRPAVKYATENVITLEELDQYALKFPICMRVLHQHLRKTHRLKYFCRMQYGLFLKALGLSLEDALQFWSEEFSKTMPMTKFRSKYMYLFKHQYGIVGCKNDYPPYDCHTILNQDEPGLKELQGCPYKHWTTDSLSKKLAEYGLPQWRIVKILETRNKEKYTEACGQFFEGLNSRPPAGPVIHPNRYFQDACMCSGNGLDGDMEDFFAT